MRNELFKDSFRLNPNSSNFLNHSFVEGIVIGIQNNIVTVDAGLKMDIKFTIQELAFLSDIREGMCLKLYVLSLENMYSECILSPHTFNKKVKDKLDTISYSYYYGRVLNTVKGGFSVGLCGKVAFLPKSEAKRKNIFSLRKYWVDEQYNYKPVKKNKKKTFLKLNI